MNQSFEMMVSFNKLVGDLNCIKNPSVYHYTTYASLVWKRFVVGLFELNNYFVERFEDKSLAFRFNKTLVTYLILLIITKRYSKNTSFTQFH